jgi:uncharacterized lipoprotein
MGKMTKITGILLCFVLVMVISGCNSGEKLRGVYSTADNTNDSLKFISGSRVTFNLDGEKNEGTYKIYEKTITITVKRSPKYIILTIIDENTLSRQRQFSKRVNGVQIFTKEK